MKEREKLTTAIIALFVFVVFVFGASYAYFTTSVTINNNYVNLNLNMPSKAPACSVTCNKTTIQLSPTTLDLTFKPSSSRIISTDAVSCNANYSGASTNGTKCQFDVIWYYETGSDIYNRDTTNHVTGWEYDFSGNLGGLTNITGKYMPNTNGNVIVSDVYVAGNGETAEKGFVFTTKLYNSTVIQDGMVGKHYIGKLKIENVEIVPI